MMISLLYLSRSTLELPRQRGEVDEIVKVAQRRNRELDVTGALVFTERHFAQNLEGPEAAVDTLMASIRRDPRHRDVEVVYREPLPARRFETWAMAYAGPSTFVSGNVLPLADAGPPAARRKAAERLIRLMVQFVDAHLIEQRRNSAGGQPFQARQRSDKVADPGNQERDPVADSGRDGGGDSAGGAYPNPHRGKKPESGGFMGHGGQTEMPYHGEGQLGEQRLEGNENAPAEKD